jgi:hypothetical protein
MLLSAGCRRIDLRFRAAAWRLPEELRDDELVLVRLFRVGDLGDLGGKLPGNEDRGGLVEFRGGLMEDRRGLIEGRGGLRAWRIESLRGLRFWGFFGPKVNCAPFPLPALGLAAFFILLEGDGDFLDIGWFLVTECVDVDDPEVEDPDVIK